jgi:3-oxoacyl-[acyl-carrier protein] reductase
MTRDSTSDNDLTVSGPSIDERESDQNPELVLRDMPLALVTGGARANSIGAAITPRLSADGWDVATSDLTDGEYPCDLAMTDGPQALVDAVNRDRGPIGALVLSHAHDELSGILDTTAASFDRHVAVNARASLLLIAAFARQISPDGGAVVALTSDATTGNLPYGASKGALDRIVISAARELGHLGISANAVNPGPIDTGWMDDDVRRSLVPDQPTGRLGLPTDIADVVAFLVSEPGRWISGQLLHVDGGFSARF